VDYMAEAFNLYTALQHANIPVDFVDEDDLTRRGLAPYKVLYVTAPNLPEEGQRGIAAWARAGGTLVTVSGAGARDRYDEPCSILRRLTGIEEQPRERLLIRDLAALKPVGKVNGAAEAIGVRGVLTEPPAGVEATFEDGSPATVQRRVGWWGKGRAIHFAWMPGLSYAKSSNERKDGLPVGFSAAIRRWILRPAELAGIRPPVTIDRPMIEAPLLLSDKGAAVTLLNWSGEPLERVKVSVRLPFAALGVESVKQGKLAFERTTDGIAVSLPLGAADILMIRRSQ